MTNLIIIIYLIYIPGATQCICGFQSPVDKQVALLLAMSPELWHVNSIMSPSLIVPAMLEDMNCPCSITCGISHTPWYIVGVNEDSLGITSYYN